jgi:DNA-directed RNA polymerase subunit RPC12/RpoP
MDDIDEKLDAIARKAYICPRCGGAIPNNETPGAYPGALSRADNETYVCSACGTHEAMEQFTTGRLTPISEWPITGEALADLRKWEEMNRQARTAAEELRRIDAEQSN